MSEFQKCLEFWLQFIRLIALDTSSALREINQDCTSAGIKRYSTKPSVLVELQKTSQLGNLRIRLYRLESNYFSLFCFCFSANYYPPESETYSAWKLSTKYRPHLYSRVKGNQESRGTKSFVLMYCFVLWFKANTQYFSQFQSTLTSNRLYIIKWKSSSEHIVHTALMINTKKVIGKKTFAFATECDNNKKLWEIL